MSQIHVPIDITNLSGVIPPGDDILYSTLCNVMYAKITLPLRETEWDSYILITRSGFASFTLIGKEKAIDLLKYNISQKGNFIPKFAKWEELDSIKFFKSEIVFKLANREFLHYIVKFDEKFESKEKFKQRKNDFGGFCRALYEKRKEQLNLNK